MQLLLPDGRRIGLAKSVISIGSDGACDVVLSAGDVKPSHALLLQEGTALTVVQGPKGGRIKVNGRRVDTAALVAGDVLSVGKADLRVEADPAPADAAQATPRGRLVRQLADFAARLLARRPARELLDHVLRGMVEATEAGCGFVVVDEPAGRRVLASHGADAEAAVSDSLVTRAFASGAPVLVEDVASEAALAQAPSIVSLRIASAVAVPLTAPGAPRAVVYLGRTPAMPRFAAEDADVAMALASLAALLLATSQELLTLGAELEGLTARLQLSTVEGMVGDSPAMRELYRRVERLGPTTLNVLVRGETGTGKELVARALHRRSGRRGRFMALSCAALPEALAERDLFGHVRGAFSGAVTDQPGVFEAADGGTLFLDEVGEMPPQLQVKLLRVLQEREVTRLGETRPRRVDVRVIAATHVDLERAVATGAFRSDLLYRLNEVDVRVPPLRERGDDVLLLAHHALRMDGGPARGFTHRAEELLRGHPFPGNVRQLLSAVRRAALLCKGEQIDPDSLGLAEQTPMAPLEQARDAFVERYVREAIARAGGNKRKAAELLGVGVRSVFRYLGEDEA